MNIERRMEIERRIIARFIDDAFKQQYALRIGGDVFTFSAGLALKAATTCDENHVTVTVSDCRRVIGMVLFVLGNDGFDVIAEYTTGPEMTALISGAESLAAELENEES
jgi:hypothetical protein